MLTKDKITEIFCISDDFCKEFNEEIKKHRLSACCGKKRRHRICTIFRQFDRLTDHRLNNHIQTPKKGYADRSRQFMVKMFKNSD